MQPWPRASIRTSSRESSLSSSILPVHSVSPRRTHAPRSVRGDSRCRRAPSASGFGPRSEALDRSGLFGVVLHLEGGAAPARRYDIRVVDREAGALEAVDVVDL